MHQQPVAIGSQAWSDPRFKMFNDLPEDQFEAFLSVPILCRGKLVGVINVQHRPQNPKTPKPQNPISLNYFHSRGFNFPFFYNASKDGILSITLGF